jgi:transcriptional regulator with XRE-family HTH domain
MASISDEKRKEIFARNLNYYVEKVNKSQKEVAKECGVTPQSLNNWLQALSLPRMGVVQQLADYFGIKYTDLLEEHTKTDSSVPDDDPVFRIYPHTPEEEAVMRIEERATRDEMIQEMYAHPSEAVKFAKLYKKYESASPEIRAAIDTLLKTIE